MKPERGPSHVTAFENTDFSLTHFGPSKTYLVVRSYLQALMVQPDRQAITSQGHGQNFNYLSAHDGAYFTRPHSMKMGCAHKEEGQANAQNAGLVILPAEF